MTLVGHENNGWQAKGQQLFIYMEGVGGWKLIHHSQDYVQSFGLYQAGKLELK